MSEDLEQKLKNIKNMIDSSKKDNYESRSERIERDKKLFHRFWIQLIAAIRWSWANILSPIKTLLFGWIGWSIVKYKDLWAYSVYTRNKYGTLEFSKTRAGIMLTTTFVAFYYMLIPVTLFSSNALVYLITNDRETVYLSTSQEIDASNNVHAVKGCYEIPCSDKNAIYYRIEPSLFNQVWKIVNDRTLFYPDIISSGVPSVISKCDITTYGFRIKFLINNLDIYPKILKLGSCDPVQKNGG